MGGSNGISYIDNILLLLMVNSTKSRYCVFTLRVMYVHDFNTENIDGLKLILYLLQGIEY